MAPAELAFDSPDLLAWVAGRDVEIDAVPFGVVAMDRSGVVTGYNLAESELSGLDPAAVIGRLAGALDHHHRVADAAAGADRQYLLVQRR